MNIWNLFFPFYCLPSWHVIVDSVTSNAFLQFYIFRPIHTQRIPANVKDVIIGDINGDGSQELVISLTDRVVRTYKWVTNSSLTMSTPPPSPESSSPVTTTSTATATTAVQQQLSNITNIHSGRYLS